MTYEFTGTLKEIKNLLVCEFGFSPEEAKVAATLLILDELNEHDEITSIDFNDNEKFTKSIGQTRYYIAFTELKKQILKDSVGTFVSVCEGNKLEIAISLLKSLKNMVKYVEEINCCVYFAALQWKIDTNNRNAQFTVDDIAKIMKGNEYYCVHLDKINSNKFKCVFHKNDYCRLCDSYQLNKFIKDSIERLCDKHILEPVNGSYDFVK